MWKWAVLVTEDPRRVMTLGGWWPSEGGGPRRVVALGG